MKTILKDNINELIIQKSRFITLLFKVETKTEINDKLKEVKKEYPNASHYCYAYILDVDKKCCDDGEPTGTAGIPILNVLEKQQLQFVLAIVVRYFGGIKLGTGGLLRAYQTSIVEALKQNEIVSLTKGYFISFDSNYEDEKLFLEYNFQKKYLEKIHYEGKVTIEQAFILKENHMIKNFSIKKECYVEH